MRERAAVPLRGRALAVAEERPHAPEGAVRAVAVAEGRGRPAALGVDAAAAGLGRPRWGAVGRGAPRRPGRRSRGPSDAKRQMILRLLS
jgi:hypothetical protein